MLPWTYGTAQNSVTNTALRTFAQNAILRACIIAHRYYDGTAYQGDHLRGGIVPLAFAEWDSTIFGERPPCTPLPKRIVEISSQFLFGDTPHIQIGDPEDDSEESLQRFLDDVVLRPNNFYQNLLDEARACSIEGATEYKWAWTPDTPKKPVSIQTYHPYDLTYFRSELNPEQIDLVRIQFKYSDYEDKWWWYREEWTVETMTVYQPLSTYENDDSSIVKQMQYDRWPVKSREANPFGIIPIQKVYNRRKKGLYEGIGDYWEPNIYRLFDIYNHKTWFEHFSDQTMSNPALVFVDIEFQGKLIPGHILLAQSNGDHPAIEQARTENPAREYLQLAKADVRKDIFDGCGYDDIDPAIITNKGNLTQAVQKLIFSKCVESTKYKRVNWGLALETFFEQMMEGLSNLPDAVYMYPALKKVNKKDPKTYDVTFVWPDDFDYSPEEVGQILNNLGLAVSNGFLTPERATEISAKAFRITDISELIDELKDVHEDLDVVRQANRDQAVNAANAEAENGNENAD